MAEDDYGLLIDFEWCTGCFSCTVAGRNANGLDLGQSCITVGSGERQVDGRTVPDFLPEPTRLCNLCAPRTRRGLDPACAHHCPPRVIRYGTRAELERLREERPNQTLWFLGPGTD